MKFLLTYVSEQNEPPSPEKMAAIAALTEEMTRAGVLIMTGGLQRASKGTRIRHAEGKTTVIDGPFPETKELIDGFALVNASSRAEAMALADRFMKIAGDGEGDVLAVYLGDDEPPH